MFKIFRYNDPNIFSIIEFAGIYPDEVEAQNEVETQIVENEIIYKIFDYSNGTKIYFKAETMGYFNGLCISNDLKKIYLWRINKQNIICNYPTRKEVDRYLKMMSFL